MHDKFQFLRGVKPTKSSDWPGVLSRPNRNSMNVSLMTYIRDKMLASNNLPRIKYTSALPMNANHKGCGSKS
jgi:hypothetical protein